MAIYEHVQHISEFCKGHSYNTFPLLFFIASVFCPWLFSLLYCIDGHMTDMTNTPLV